MIRKTLYRIIVLVMVLVIIPMIIFVVKGYSAMDNTKIDWGMAYQKNGVTYIPGDLKMETGNFSLLWKVQSNYRQLIFINTSNAGGVSGIEEKLYILFHNKATAAICRELLPLRGNNELPMLKQVAITKTCDLFKVLKLAFQYKELSYEETIKPIQWGSPYQENGSIFVPGTVKTSFGTFNFFVKIGLESIPKLITMMPTGSADVKPIEEKLFLIQDPVTGTSTLLKERIPLLNSPDPPMLQKIVTVDTANFKEWEKQLNKQE